MNTDWVLFMEPFFPTTALARFAFGHNKHLNAVGAPHWKPQSSLLTSLPSLSQIKAPGSGDSNPGSIMEPLLRIGPDNSSVIQDGRISSRSHLASSGIMHGSPLSDDSSQHSDSAIVNDGISNSITNTCRLRPLDSTMYSHCVTALRTLANDPSPCVASLGRRVLSIIGIEQVVTKPFKAGSSSLCPSEPVPGAASLLGLARSSSWFEMHASGIDNWPFLYLSFD